MYNSDIPTRAELPTSAQLIKSTIIAFVVAMVLLVTVVLPSEYAIDPTGVGKAMGLTQMGEIKLQLAEEAEADRVKDQEPLKQQTAPKPDQQSSLTNRVLGFFVIGSAHASEPVTAPVQLAQAVELRSDETVIRLNPTEGTEYKMPLKQGDVVTFSWAVENGVVSYDMHGTKADGGGEESYKKDRGIQTDEGALTAAFDGTHGWFFRNRGDAPVTIRLKTSGPYAEIKKVM